MMRHIRNAAVAFWALASVTAPAAAQSCPEGRTADGSCVDPGLAADARQRAVIYAQPKLSETTPPVLPSDDANSHYPGALTSVPAMPSPTGIADPKAKGD